MSCVHEFAPNWGKRQWVCALCGVSEEEATKDGYYEETTEEEET